MTFLFLLSLIVGLVYAAGLFLFIAPYRKTEDGEKSPFVSILIAARNEEAVIGKTLRTLKKIDYPRYEIIVVDGSSDRTAIIAKKYARVVKEEKPHGKSHALNIGVKKSKGDVIYVLDADSRPKKDTLRKLVTALGGHEAAVGINIPENKNNFLARVSRAETAYISAVEKITSGLIGTTIIPGRNFVIYKKTLKKMGGFQNVLTEDLNLAWRLYKKGKNVALAPAKCYEQVPDRFSWYFKQQRRWISGSFLEVGKLSKHLTPTELLIILPSLFFVAAIPAAILTSIVLYLLTKTEALLAISVLGIIIMLLSEINYLDKDDIKYFPFTLLALGFLQWINVIDAFFGLVFREKIAWYKTPKEKM